MKTILYVIFIFAGLCFSQQIKAQEKCTCTKCNGEGMCDEDTPRKCIFCTGGYNTCNTCDGDGLEPCYRCNKTGIAQITCNACGGSGKLNGENCGTCGGDGLEDKSCINCDGKGWNKCHSCGGDGRLICNMCGGDGEKYWRNICPNCGGTGKVDCE